MLAKSIPTSWREGHDLVCLQNSDSESCFLQSQEWQGSDYIRWIPLTCYNRITENILLECDDPNFTTDLISPGMKDITKLYDAELLCSECFVKIWRQRLMSSSLPKSEYSDYLMEQYEAIQSFCSMTLPVSTYSSTLVIPTSIETTAPTPTASPPVSPDTCEGQVIQPAEHQMGCDL
ncbi:hypothetical protein BDV12DRAFT_177236 [Aspergillus spectabilis]